MKAVLKIFIVCAVILVGFSWIPRVKYDISLIEYLKYSLPLTDEERAYLEEKDTLIYGMDRKAPPLTFVNEETGQNEGLLVDYVSSLSIELGINIDYEPLIWNDLLVSLKNQSVDMADLFESEARSKTFAFSQPLYLLRGIVVTTEDHREMEELSQLAGKRIAVADGDYTEELLLDMFSEENSITLVTVRDVEEGIELLIGGSVDALAGDETVIDYYTEMLQVKKQICQIGDCLYEKNVTFAVNKEDTQLLTILNKGILQLKKKNILVRTQEKWFGSSSLVITDSSALNWLPMVVLVASLIFLIFFVWEHLLGRQIQDKTCEIQMQKDNLRTIIDTIHAMLLVINEEHMIFDLNQNAREQLSGEDTPLIGQTVDEFPLLASLLAFAEQGGDGLHQYDGRYYSVFLRPLHAEDAKQLLIIEDLTEKTLAERKLRQESKMIAVGQLSAGLAHEIRNPLGLIRTYSYILQGRTSDEVSSHALNVIGASTDRINHFIENLLNFSRLGNDTPSWVDMDQILKNMISLERKKLESAGVTTVISCPSPCRLYTNEETVKIILVNLIHNAMDALAETAAPEIRIVVATESQGFTFSVYDNGPGIPADQIETVFNPFFTTKDTGTGLGLYIVNMELEKVGGSIHIDSSPQAGTTFTVFIPVKHGEDQIQEVSKMQEVSETDENSAKPDGQENSSPEVIL